MSRTVRALHFGKTLIPPLVQAVDLRRNSDAEAWSHSICYFSLKTWQLQ
jgi:hypothetical protein